MKKIFDSFYIFSKFAISFILLICLIGTLYILFVNYKKENTISKKQISFENEIKENINNNFELINNAINKMKNNEVALAEITESIKSLKNLNNSNDISLINENIKTLNNNFSLLSEEIKNLKENNFKLSSNEEKNKKILDKNINEIINLIMIKYENNLNFDFELDYLREIMGNDKTITIEKISILSDNPFKGYEYLNTVFNDEINHYTKKIINTNPDSLFSKIILPYINVSPTTENKVTDDLILKIKKIKFDFDNRNIDDAFKNLKTIKNYNKEFEKTSNEINKLIKFKFELYGLK